MNTATRPFAFLLLLLLASGPASAGLPEETAPAESLPRVLLDAGSAREAFDSYIVYYRNDAAPGEEKARAAADARKAIDRDLARVGAQLALDVRRERRLATGGHLLRLSAPLGKAASRAFMEAMANNPAVEFIEPNARRRAVAVPNDSRYAEQWAMHEAEGGLNIEPAWDHSMGNGIVIAILDTGQTSHPDLDAKTLPGYDFISNADNAGDGNGRDSNPADPGDWHPADYCFEGQEAEDSGWHGTHVAGIAAAITHNGTGIAGAAPGALLQHVRVLGKCGGSTADIAEAIVWASGAHVAGIADNPTPARVINLSLGGEGECSQTEQRAIDRARARNSVVLIAAGNEAVPASRSSPGNCGGVITVAANNREGKRADYSNYGQAVEITAPGGGASAGDSILSTINAGSREPGHADYGWKSGTSMATPYVAGVAALMLERRPSLTPDQVSSILRDTARPFPRYCLGGCGSGIVDAAAAVRVARGGSITAYPVSIALFGNGEGAVTSLPSRIQCGSACSARFDAGTTTTLSAVPEDGYVFAGWNGACTGTSLTCTLAMNRGHAVSATFKIPVQTMHNGSVRSGLSASGDRKLMFSVDVPAGATNLVFEMSGGSGDADLYVRRDAEPTTDGETYDCRPWKLGNNETCSFQAPLAGRYFAMISAGADYSGVQFAIRYTAGPNGGTPLTRGVAVNNLAIPEGGARYFRLSVPQGATHLNITMQGSGSGSGSDVDLYVRRDAVPTLGTFDCRPYLSGSNETCAWAAPAAGTYYLLLHGATAASGIRLTATYTPFVPTRQLTIQWAGLGGGSVAIRRAATGETLTTCGAFPCVVAVPENISYDLIPGAAFGSSFAEWQGVCDALPAANQCRIKLAAARSLTARFVMSRPNSPVLTIERQGTGNGTVQVKRVATGQVLGTCTQYPCRLGPVDATHELIATPGTGSRFLGWSASQCGSIVNGHCRVRISQPTTVTARFSPQ